MDKSIKEISTPIMAFTFFFAVTIYVFMISFFFWLTRKDIKPEKLTASAATGALSEKQKGRLCHIRLQDEVPLGGLPFKRLYSGADF